MERHSRTVAATRYATERLRTQDHLAATGHAYIGLAAAAIYAANLAVLRGVSVYGGQLLPAF
ncbi:hypothetical protein D3C81_1990720 [compost metagenome]